MLISKLNEKEMEKIPFYYKKWFNISRHYQPLDQKKCNKLLKSYLKECNSLLSSPLLTLYDLNHFFYFDSPLACQLAINVLNVENLKQFVETYMTVQISNSKKSFHRLLINVASKLLNYLPAITGIKMGNDVLKFANYLHNYFKDNKLNYVDINWYGSSGNLQAGYCALYEFFINEVIPNYELNNVPSSDKLKLWEKYKAVNEQMHVFWIFDDIVICSEKPTQLQLTDNRLHSFKDAACSYADGFELYYMCGVEFPENIVKMKPEDMDIAAIFKETNVEKRSILTEKIGIERLLENCESKIIESQTADVLYQNYPTGNYYQHGDVLIKPEEGIKETTHQIENLQNIPYTLISLNLNNTNVKYLIMKNASNSHKHIEGVPNDINTISEAIFWRNQTNYLPCKLS